MSITSTTNYGKLSEEQSHELDCTLDTIAEANYMFDPQPCYQLSENDKGETIGTFENGFELYILPEVIESLRQ